MSLGAQSGTATASGGATRPTPGARRYAPLDQINASNFNTLEVAWRFKTDQLGPRPEFQFESTPLMVDGIVYSTGGTRARWSRSTPRPAKCSGCTASARGARGAAAPRQLSGRGLAVLDRRRTTARILYVTPGYRLIALDAEDRGSRSQRSARTASSI